MQVNQLLCHPSNCGGKRNTSQIKYIVIHYTANDGDNAKNNCIYYQRANIKASAHYYCDDNSIWQSVPDDTIAWAVGGSKYKNTKGGTLHGIATNTNSISIETTDTVRNGVIYPTQATINNVLGLTRFLMDKYKIPKERVIRHYDVTGKLCPAYWVDNTRWKTEFLDKLDNDKPFEILFDARFYANLYPDLMKAFGENEKLLYQHFEMFGMSEGRCASPVFDPKFYKEKYADLKRAFGDDCKKYFQHFLTYTVNGSEGRRGSELFDVKYYRGKYKDLDNAFGNKWASYFAHWKRNGLHEWRATSDAFNIEVYKDSNPDLERIYAADKIIYFVHWFKNQSREKRVCK